MQFPACPWARGSAASRCPIAQQAHTTPSCFCVRQGKLLVADAEVAELQEALAAEEAKHAAWRDENIRRRHNYIPFLFEMLKEMARRGQLQGLIDAARAGKGAGGQQGASAMNLG